METAVLKKKICLLGNFGVGKTSLIRRFVLDTFEDQYLSTIGVKVSKKEIGHLSKDNNEINLQLLIWDVEGFDKTSISIENYYTGASGAIIVADLSRAETLKSLPKIRDNFLKINPQAKIIILGNKIDLFRKEPANLITTIKKYARSFECKFYTTSAKTGKNVETCFNKLSQMLIEV